ncbi:MULTISPECIES: hypothetical protein [Halobacterium]|uniref:Uncharacterized protein n=6 Tax=Halobacterium salinarum TaxID=2242 RepID=Q9HMS9_HALSA|nr:MULTISPECIES: hypothetical protein [Halobacterium]AAG20492.1 hypothetical protein VNG_2403H [Halobacterium salinarum NRC-1]MBB6089577.1 hypothetical protein [Halobacterium salinarum]MDL0118461.1 hypothetical protein [Halobacterium salinarum]MDL0122744.1 hypothetical protein [Halobacterium salinarum]MDL0124264.1 hypothetical protein [Halobacterium salinarum]
MFTERALDGELAAVRDAYAPDAVVLDCDADFETLSPEHRDDVLPVIDDLTPHEYDTDWLPADSPALLTQLATREFVVGMPGDGAVAWTTQTEPPVVFVKARIEGTPSEFADFLVAEALVAAGLGLPERFLGLFGSAYPAFAAAVDGDPVAVYQTAAAAATAFRGLHTRPEFETWDADFPRLYDAWVDAGERIRPRLDGLSGELAHGTTSFADAAELACSAVKHDVDVPTPFAALDSPAFRRHGSEYAVTWAEKLFAADTDA